MTAEHCFGTFGLKPARCGSRDPRRSSLALVCCALALGEVASQGDPNHTSEHPVNLRRAGAQARGVVMGGDALYDPSLGKTSRLVLDFLDDQGHPPPPPTSVCTNGSHYLTPPAGNPLPANSIDGRKIGLVLSSATDVCVRARVLAMQFPYEHTHVPGYKHTRGHRSI